MLEDMKRIFLVLIAFASMGAVAQGIEDAVLFSQQYYQGTAKSMAMGGSAGAVGADFSAASINPAGLGLFRRSEMSFSMGGYQNFSRQNYNDIKLSGERESFPFNNFGMVFTLVEEESERMQLAFGINRLASFGTQNDSESTFNFGSSLLNNYLSALDGVSLDDMPYRMNPAWNTYLIDTLGGAYVTPMSGTNFSQSIENSVSGSLTDFCMSMSCSMSDKHFIGLTIGMPILSYKAVTKYSESSGSNSWNYVEKIKDGGVGVSFKAGYLYYPVSWLRFGVAWHSRSLLEVNDSWFLKYNSTLGSTNYSDQIDENSEYIFIMPARYLANAAFIIGRSGMLTLDYELVNYRGSKFGIQTYDEYAEEYDTDYSYYSYENAQIKNELRAASNIRVGAEWCLNNMRLRGGFGYFGSPYKNSDNNTVSVSGGVGFNFRRFALDFAYVGYHKTADVQPVNYSPVFQQTSWTNQFVGTLRYKFVTYYN